MRMSCGEPVYARRSGTWLDVAATGGACRDAARNPALRVAAFAERKAYDLLRSIFTLVPANALQPLHRWREADLYEQVAEVNVCFKCGES
jgi:hypothetical protein